MPNVYPITKAGKAELKEKINQLKKEQRQDVRKRIKDARTFCDFSEDPVYKDLIEEQDTLEQKIKQLEHILQHAKVLEKDNQMDTIQFGATVTFRKLPNSAVETYTIVAPIEANPLANKISVKSPVAQQLIGHKVGNKITIKTPIGAETIEIMNVE